MITMYDLLTVHMD